MVSLTSWLLYPMGNSPQYPPNRTLGGPPELVCIFLRRENLYSKPGLCRP